MKLWQRGILLGLIAVAAFAHDITGKWEFTVETGAGGGSPTFVLKQAGEKLTGNYNGALGTAQVTGTVKGDTVEILFDVEIGGQAGTVKYTGKIESASKMSGAVDLAGMATGKWTGTKKE